MRSFFMRHVPRATCVFILTLAILLFTGTVSFVRAQQPVRIALLPFENVSGSIESVRVVMPLVEQSLRGKGYQVVSAEEIETFLQRNRIRTPGMLSRRQLNDLKKAFGTDIAIVGSVDLFHESDENPQWGISARAVSTDDGNVLWAESTGRTGGDYTGMLGLGTITSSSVLAGEVVKILFQTLPLPDSPRNVSESPDYQWEDSFSMEPDFVSAPPDTQPEEPKKARLLGARRGYRSPMLDSARGWRVAATIFENRSERRGAGIILGDVLVTALLQHGFFQVSDLGEPNEALIAIGRTPYGGMDLATLRELKKRTGVDVVLIGTVYRYNEGLKRDTAASPEIELDMRMLHTETGKILWFAAAERSGSEYQIALDFGIIRSMIPLIRQVMNEMLATL